MAAMATEAFHSASRSFNCGSIRTSSEPGNGRGLAGRFGTKGENRAAASGPGSQQTQSVTPPSTIRRAPLWEHSRGIPEKLQRLWSRCMSNSGQSWRVSIPRPNRTSTPNHQIISGILRGSSIQRTSTTPQVCRIIRMPARLDIQFSWRSNALRN